jgi:hypothetical protein
MPTRTARWSLSSAMLVAAGFALTACGPGNTTPSGELPTSSPAPTSSVQPSDHPIAKNGQGSALAKPAGTAKKPGVSCTNQIDYAGDPRSNAEINSIGEQTGYCPPVSS